MDGANIESMVSEAESEVTSTFTFYSLVCVGADIDRGTVGIACKFSSGGPN